MRLPAFVAASGLSVALVGACGLDLGGLGDTAGDGGGDPTLDGSKTGEGATGGSGGSSGGGSGSTSGGSGSGGGSPVDASTDGTTGSDGPTNPLDSTAPPQDSSPGIDSSTPPDSGPTPCTTADGCYVIPGGWSLVAFAPNQSSNCPTGFSSHGSTNLDEGPSGNTCNCGSCATGTQPSCASGAVAGSYDIKGVIGAGQCGTADPGTLANSPAGACAPFSIPGGFGGMAGPAALSDVDLKFTPPAASGGACTTPGVAGGNVTFASQDRTCAPDSASAAGCNGNQCTVTLPAPYVVCVEQSGTAPCPGTPFTHAHAVGTGGSFTCSACGCSVTADCSGNVDFFTDGNCVDGMITVAANGQCNGSNGAANATYASYKYVGNAPSNVTCHSSGSSTASPVTLANAETICCAQ